MKYPLPAQAASIWFDGDQLWIGLSSTVGEAGHCIPLPADLSGFSHLLRILTARRDSVAARRIGNDGSPTRAQIEAVMRKRESDRVKREARAEAPPKRVKKEKIAEINLEELGL